MNEAVGMWKDGKRRVSTCYCDDDDETTKISPRLTSLAHLNSEFYPLLSFLCQQGHRTMSDDDFVQFDWNREMNSHVSTSNDENSAFPG